MVNASGVAKRIQFFCQWKYGIDVSLYWSASGGAPFHGEDWQHRPPSLSGDGLLFYPDEALGFVPSLRAELLREGTQDYRALLYLQTLKAQAEERNLLSDKDLAKQVEEILAVNWITSVVDYPEAPEILQKERLRLNRTITKLHHLLK